MEDARLETVAARQAHVRRSVCGERLAHKYANDLAPSANPPSDLHQVTCSWRAYAKLMSPKNAISARSSCCDSVKEWHRLR